MTVDKFALALTLNQSNITTFAGLAAEAGSAGESIKYVSYKSTDKVPVCGCASNCSYSAYCPVAQVTTFAGCYQTGTWCSTIPCTAGSLLNVYGIAGGATVPSQDGPFGGKVCVALCMCYTPGESPECALYFENVSPYNSK